MNAVENLLPTLAQYARGDDDLQQEMALALLEQAHAHPERQVNDAYRKRCTWLARSQYRRKEYRRQRRFAPARTAPVEDATDDTLIVSRKHMLLDERFARNPEEIVLERERLARLHALIPKLQQIIQTLNPTNQQIVKLILLDAGRGEIPQATGLSASAISHRKRQIRQTFEAHGLTAEYLR